MKTWKTRLIDALTIVAAGTALGTSVLVLAGKRLASEGDNTGSPIAYPEWREVIREGNRIGPPTAPVTLIEFGDYECPVCRGTHPHIKAVLRRYPQQVAYVYRHWPLPYHKFAYPAARAAECAAAQGRFAEFHDFLYENTDWYAGPRDTFVRLAKNLRVPDIFAFEACVSSFDPVPEIENDAKVAESVGTGTPTILINEVMFLGAVDSLTMFDFVEKALARR